jgi:deoxyribodipyrimidine photolyase-related protein
MQKARIVFPHQLHRQLPDHHTECHWFLVEELLFFKQFPFHKQKLILHRASMKAFEDYLKKFGCLVTYVEHHEANADVSNLIQFIQGKGILAIEFYDPTDDWLLRRITSACIKNGIEYTKHESPMFLTPVNILQEYANGKKHFHHADFYKFQRKRLNILMDESGNPVGDQWSFDEENRKKLPKDLVVPAIKTPDQNHWIQEAVRYVDTYFSNNPGNGAVGLYPVTHQDADDWLDDFIENRLNNFGPYEDALAHKQTYLFHSVLTPILNIGLIEPRQIIDRVLAYNQQKPVPIASLEGFIRQIIGWREFMRLVYLQTGSKQRTGNFFKLDQNIPDSWWNGTTGIFPIDHTIKKTLESGYAHHIERLMVLGNAMLLHRFHPNQTYEWFMSLFVDAYDWVMVPNVYGMSQFADGGMITTKPYFSGSNYLMKMGDFPKGDWQDLWDALFWYFMNKERNFFLKNHRLSMLVRSLDKMDSNKKSQLFQKAETYLNQLNDAKTLE